MESSSHRTNEERKKQSEIRKQIALLQAQLVDLPDGDEAVSPKPTRTKRKVERADSNAGGTVLAPPTPSPKKKRKFEVRNEANSPRQVPRSLDFGPPKTQANIATSSKSRSTGSRTEIAAAPTPSNFLHKLATLTCEKSSGGEHMSYDNEEGPSKPSRSASFMDPAASVQSAKPKRNEDLTLVEDLEPGPYEHKAPPDDPNFERLEPHSGIRLLSRVIPHEDICEYMRGRFYLSPSRLYSCVRLSADRQAYDVPVMGDWVTIAVVADIGEVKHTKPPVTIGPDEGEDGRGKKSKGKGKEKGKEKESEETSSGTGGKRYVNIRLVDFGVRSKGGSETGGKSVIRGDAFLSLLLFESDGFDWVEPGEDEEEGKAKKKVKVYRGGSKGAFEIMHKIRQGDVIALLNPRVLKPFQRNSASTFLANNVLAVTPENQGTIVLVGRARDLGGCTARRKDGRVCGAWCDTRVGEVCEWHMQHAVERRRASRAEFSAGTMGMTASAAVKKGRKHEAEFDPDKQWGMLPSGSSNGGTTYVLSGHVISSQSDIYIGERMGREAQAKAQRKAAGQETEKALKLLATRDRDGMKSVLRAREAGGSGMKITKKSLEESVAEEAQAKKGPGYSVSVIKGIGFNPVALAVATAGGAKKQVECYAVANKLEVLAKMQQAKKDRGIDLKPRPGERVRSGVVVPTKALEKERLEEGLVDLDDL
ncbi:hypothetical protein AX17_005459 [Amanita inopinata Kibby_2008]|nr:hypothetical protein AX17_005459 [Amanita inopinata Kibby_2008]